MSTKFQSKGCPQCGGPIPAEAPQGLCPKCLLKQAALTGEDFSHTGSKATPPSPEELTAAFPQLEVLGLIGQGGMGFVFKARQPKLDRFVALKLLPRALAADPAFAERFSREGKILARLNHPNIVTIHDFGQANGFFYLVMEYVDGVNLRQAMKAGRFTPAQALAIVPKICEALQFAHNEGILHRDVKPENILLDAKGRVKIADFGIAKLVASELEAITSPASGQTGAGSPTGKPQSLALTETGRCLGTPHYMAPEQIEQPQDVDQRADIYSLGVVFYEMLTGELPMGRFAPPSEKSPVDPRVDEVVLHALEKEREKRFRSAEEVKTRVEEITQNVAPGNSPGQNSEQPARITIPAESDSDGSVCYLSSPKRMRNCFPSAAAQVFICKGQLQLKPGHLLLITSWQTQTNIPLESIEQLSVGQFQMWTTPWVMHYARVNFISVTFTQNGLKQTIYLTPVPAGPTSVRQINEYIDSWFAIIRQAVARRTGANLSTGEPVIATAEPAWNKTGIPLLIAFLATATFSLLNSRSVFGPNIQPLAAAIFGVMWLLGITLLWYSFMFLKANHAINHGTLDAVTSNEPLEIPQGLIVPTGEFPTKPKRFFWSSILLVVLILGFAVLYFSWFVPGLRSESSNPVSHKHSVALDKQPATQSAPTKTVVLSGATNVLINATNNLRVARATTESFLSPGETLVASMKMPDGRVVGAQTMFFIHSRQNDLTKSVSFSWVLPDSFVSDDYESAVAQLRKISDKPLSIAAAEPLQVFYLTNRSGGAVTGYLQYDRPVSDTANPTPTAQVRCRSFGASLLVFYTAKVPPGYSLEARDNSADLGEGEAFTAISDSDRHSSWIAPRSFAWEQQRQAGEQIQRLANKGPIEIAPGQPFRVFSITNNSGDVYEGSLQLVGPSAAVNR